MKTPTYRALWQEQLQKDHADLAEILTWDLYEYWDRNRMPESTAAGQLQHALELLYGRIDPKMADAYLGRAIDSVDRALAEDKFRRSKWCKPGFPENRGLAERVRQYAHALQGKGLDNKALLAAAEDIIDYWRDWSHPLEDQMHARWLAAVRMALIAGDPARALAMIGEARSLKRHQKEADLLTDISSAATEAQPIKDTKLLARLDKFFDKVRSPDWQGPERIFHEPAEQRFELGAIRHQYFVSKDRSIDWEAVIESIRR